MAPNIIGLGLIVAAIIFMIIGGLVLWILGVICLIGGVGALFMTWQRKRRAAADARARRLALREDVVVRARLHVAALAERPLPDHGVA